MGLSALRGTEVYQFVSTCIPRESEIAVTKVFEIYELSVLPQYINTLGSMCDYGVRSYYPVREYAYVELGMIRHGYNPYIEALLEEERLTAEEAYQLCTMQKGKLGHALVNDYNEILHRTVSLYRCLALRNPHYGKYCAIGGKVGTFECDCADDKSVVDLKVCRKFEHNREHWTQVLLYSMLAKCLDNKARKTLCLLYPVQGEIRTFTYVADEYYEMWRRFKELLDKEECVCI